MKQLSYNLKLFFLSGFVLALTACGDDFLEPDPPGRLLGSNFFETQEHAIAATNATYQHLRAWSVHVFSYIGMTDIVSDDADKGSTPDDASFLRELDNFTYDASNVGPSTVWEGYYQGIYRANLAIENIPDIQMDEALKARLIGENKFLRAYFYFNLVRWFGDVPLITSTLTADEFTQTRTPREQVYDQIIKDLMDAAAVLPTKSKYPVLELGRATQGAANGLLAKVHLTRMDYQQAADYALTVINSGEYSLASDYSSIFSKAGENGPGSLFEVQTAAFEPAIAGSQYNEVQGVRGTPNLGWGFNRPSDNLVASYEPGDPRREATILYPGEVLPDGSDIVQDNPDIVGERYNQKAWVPEHVGGNGNGPGNIRILRYADILLIAAEALNELGQQQEALTYLNMVRARARGSRNVLPDITTTNQAELREIIWRERRVELALEQHRWFDLVRTNRAAERMQAVGKTNFTEGKHELFPIPQSEIDLSAGNLQQNSGY